MSEEGPRHPHDLTEGYREWGGFVTWGWQFALTLGVLVVAGHWADGKLNTSPLFILLGIFSGLFGGFYNLYRLIIRLPSNTKRNAKRNIETKDRD